jgi:ubiquinone/menaquinone biosynthesis C-methylase UbiE
MIKMNVFKKYADFYDSLYEAKNYQQECNFVKHVFKTYSEKKVNTILELGCGTGSHALLFADMGYAVTGVDISENMLEIARKKVLDQKKRITFMQQDIRHLDLTQKFDAAVAMFAVMGYQTTNQDFEDTLTSVRRHLDTGGLFVFDVWFGPAVLTQKPSERVKIIEQKDKKIIRYAHPVLNIINHTVEVNYTVLEIAGDKVLTETEESHLMRFFFYQELKYFLETNGFEVLKMIPFMEINGVLSEDNWDMTVVARRTK